VDIVKWDLLDREDEDMLSITGYTVELIKDPFGILTGARYEFLLDIEVPDDDELYSEKGVYIRVIYNVDDNTAGMVKYEIVEQSTDQYLNFELEEDEAAYVESFCKEHLAEA
jgi:hypothetical protein